MLYRIAQLMSRGFCKLVFRLEVDDFDLPEGSVIFSGNHRSNWDAIIAAAACPRQIHFMGKKELFSNRFLAWLFGALGAFPVERGQSDLKAIRRALAVLKEGQVLGLFPEGTRIDQISEDNMKEGVGFLAVRGQAPVQTIYIEGDYKVFHKMRVKNKGLVDPKDYEDKAKRDQYQLVTQAVFHKIYQGEV